MKIKANCTKCGKYAKLDELGGICRVCKKKSRGKGTPQKSHFKGVFG